MKLLIVFVLLIISLISCNNATNWESKVNNAEDLLKSFKKEIEIRSEVFISDSVNLLNPFTIHIIGDYLFIEENLNPNNKFYSIYDIESKRYIGDFMSRGKGPNEFLRLKAGRFNNDTIMILDVFKKEALLFSKKKIELLDEKPDRKFQLNVEKEGDLITGFLWLDNINQLICNGQFGNGSLHRFDENGQWLDFFGSYPEISSNKEIDNYQLGFVFGTDASLASNNKIKNKFACSESYAFSIYEKSSSSFEKKFVVQWNASSVIDASYKDGRPLVLRSAKDIVGSGNIAATEKYLFFPFSEYSNGELMKQRDPNFNKQILVLDWKGTPIVKMELDRGVSFPLEIDKKGEFLYSIHTDTNTGFPQIIRFNLQCLKGI